ncbi:MAG: CoA-binding protein [Thermoprotei archaeon]
MIPPDGLTDEEVKAILENSKRVMVIGMSRDPAKAAGEVPLFLKSVGYEIIPVNPFAEQIAGIKAYKSFSDFHGTVDVIDVFRPSAEIPTLVDELKSEGFKTLWLQEGIYDGSVGRLTGKSVVWNRCMMKEYKRLILNYRKP